MARKKLKINYLGIIGTLISAIALGLSIFLIIKVDNLDKNNNDNNVKDLISWEQIANSENGNSITIASDIIETKNFLLLEYTSYGVDFTHYYKTTIFYIDYSQINNTNKLITTDSTSFFLRKENNNYIFTQIELLKLISLYGIITK